MQEAEGTNEKGQPYLYKFCVVNDIQYRIPNPVLEQIQNIIALKPEVKFVKVEKSGTGVATKYKVRVI